MQAEGLAYAEPRALSRSNTLQLRPHLGASVHSRMLKLHGHMLRADEAATLPASGGRRSLSGPGHDTDVPSALTPCSSPPTQDTADYVKPVTFSVEYSLEDPDYGPMLDDGWPTTLRVSVRPGIQGSSFGTHPTATPRLLPEAQALRQAQRSSSPASPSHLLPCKFPAGSSPPSSQLVLSNFLKVRTWPSPVQGSRIPSRE